MDKLAHAKLDLILSLMGHTEVVTTAARPDLREFPNEIYMAVLRFVEGLQDTCIPEIVKATELKSSMHVRQIIGRILRRSGFEEYRTSRMTSPKRSERFRRISLPAREVDSFDMRKF